MRAWSPPSPLPGEYEPVKESDEVTPQLEAALPQTPEAAPTTPQAALLGGSVLENFAQHVPGDQSPTITRTDVRLKQQSATQWQAVDDMTRIKELEKELAWEKRHIECRDMEVQTESLNQQPADNARWFAGFEEPQLAAPGSKGAEQAAASSGDEASDIGEEAAAAELAIRPNRQPRGKQTNDEEQGEGRAQSPSSSSSSSSSDSESSSRPSKRQRVASSDEDAEVPKPLPPGDGQGVGQSNARPADPRRAVDYSDLA
mmetsp:Transcript_54978/g.128549  ORF Transcript_54978/g.128549 Transcript_54978/m.128549 type:complete len:258 (-) Transcript_54978:18-791(-)